MKRFLFHFLLLSMSQDALNCLTSKLHALNMHTHYFLHYAPCIKRSTALPLGQSTTSCVVIMCRDYQFWSQCSLVQSPTLQTSHNCSVFVKNHWKIMLHLNSVRKDNKQFQGNLRLQHFSSARKYFPEPVYITKTYQLIHTPPNNAQTAERDQINDIEQHSLSQHYFNKGVSTQIQLTLLISSKKYNLSLLKAVKK